MIRPDDLRSFKYLSDAPAKALEGLAQTMSEQTFEAGATILKEGEQSKALYLIVSGAVRVQKGVRAGEESVETVARLGAGEFLGEVSFFDRKPLSATVVAEEPTRLFALPRAALDELVRKDAAFAIEQILALFSSACSRLRTTTRDLAAMAQIARVVGAGGSLESLLRDVLSAVRGALGGQTSAAVYKWNPFNDEYFLVSAQGAAKDDLEPVIDLGAPVTDLPGGEAADLSLGAGSAQPLAFLKGHLLTARIDTKETREGLLLLYSDSPRFFGREDKSLVGTIAEITAPALVSARLREEETARQLYERQKRAGYGS